MSDDGAVQFRVFKGSKFLFECEIAHADTLPATLRQQLVRADEFGLLRNVDLAITKRLNLVEVDRMIACCRQHPPQTVATPITNHGSSENCAAFEDFAAYLKQRERAGVASLASGVLVLLIPLMGRNNYMQCQIVNTKSTVSEIGAQVALASPRELQPLSIQAPAPFTAEQRRDQEDVFIKEEVHSPAVARAPAMPYSQLPVATQTSVAQVSAQQSRSDTSSTQASSAQLPTPAPTTQLPELPMASNGAVADQQPQVLATQAANTNRPTAHDSPIAATQLELATHSNATDNADTRPQGNGDHDESKADGQVDAAVEPETVAVDPYAELRQEYDAFNACYHHVLLEWSTKPSDIDSATELCRHALP